MNKIFKYFLMSTFALIFMTISCKKTEYTVVDDALFLSEASASASKKMIIDEKGATVSVTPRMVQRALNDVTAKIIVDTNALNDFNKKHGTNYKPIPLQLLNMSANEVQIQKGQTSGTAISVSIKPFTEEMAQSGEKFALALGLKDVSGTDLLASLSEFIYEFDQVIVTSVPILNRDNLLNRDNPVTMAMRQDYNLKEWSIEMRVNMDRLGTSIGQYNNQAIMGIFGNNSEIYIRFGDAPIPGNILQIKTQGTQINCNTVFAVNTWYHLAFVCDGATLKVYVNGSLDATLAVPGNVSHLDRTKFGMVNSGSYFVANCMLSEVRFWTKPISQNQIQNNMFTINPKSDGLEAYWKMNEGEGNVFKDATGHGNTATASEFGGSVVRWKEGVRSDGK